MIEAGHFTAFLALAFSVLQGGYGLAGKREQSALFARLGFVAMAVAFLTLIWAFARTDFSVARRQQFPHAETVHLQDCRNLGKP